jgi:signal transduction histidine kinase
VEKNRRQEQMMLQQMRLAQMGEMISMIAHQWRQPLNAIGITAANMELNAMGNRFSDADVVRGAQDIATYVRHLSGTIEDFRNFFQPDKERGETTYDALIDSVMEIIKPSVLDKQIDVILEPECHEPFTTYVNEVRQVFLNLVKNAEDILVERIVIEHPYIKIATFREGDEYVLSVSDNGGGVPETVMERIFDPYFSTKNRKNGTGLGLYMSKVIVEEHCHGTLTVGNDAEGAVFTMRLRNLSSAAEMDVQSFG